MRFLDLFAGIGGFRLALEQAGHKCVGFCEIDKFARQTYKANFDTEGEVEWHDITAVTDDDVRQLGSVDIITGGFPCQAFSVAGKRGGFDDTRGTLFFEIARIARILRPRYLLLENVKGLLNHAGGETFHTILNTLAELGYWWEYQVLNSKDFGVPQNRERVFIIGHSRRFPRREIFPITDTTQADIPRAKCHRVFIIHDKRQAGETRIYNSGVCITVTRHWGTGGGNVPYIKHDQRYRKITPLEAFRLQGFPDSHHDKAKAAGVSDSQLYKQAGNAVTVTVVYEIAKRLG
jgi:DNA (cytosine-5)-methyltransferase 1